MHGKTEKCRVYVDPFYFHDFSGYIEPLALLVDEVFIYDPRKLFFSYEYPKSKFNELVKEEVFVPVFVQRPKDYEVSFCLTRNDIIGDWDFFPTYSQHIEEDTKDERLIKLIESALNISDKNLINDLIFSISWDLIVSQALKAYCLTPSRLKPIWEYKFSKILGEEKVRIMREFLVNYTLKVPKDLSIDQIKKLRKDKASRGLRRWFENMYNKLKDVQFQKDMKINSIEVLLREFQEMLNAEEKRIQKLSKYGATISLTFINLVGLLITPLISVVSPIAVISISTIIEKIWKHFGRSNWIFMLLDLKKS